MIICPICEKEIDLEVTYPTLEMVGHFLQEHEKLMTPEQKSINYWKDKE